MTIVPNWVQRNPANGRKRIVWELSQIREFFPKFVCKIRSDGFMYLEGELRTTRKREGSRILGGNRYRIALRYPMEYPYDYPKACIMDNDVIQHCLNRGFHNTHNLGLHPNGGIVACLFGPSSWTHEYSGITVIQQLAIWLHAIEVEMATGKWIFPEYK